MDPPRAQFNEEDVDGLEEGRLHREEVTGQDLLTMMREKAAPRAPLLAPPGCGRDVAALEHIAHGGPPDRVAQLPQFAVDAAVAPAGILAGQTQDQFFHLGADTRAAGDTALPKRPFAPDQVPMPAQHRLRREQKQAWAPETARPRGHSLKLAREHRQRQFLPTRRPTGRNLRALQHAQVPAGARGSPGPSSPQNAI